MEGRHLNQLNMKKIIIIDGGPRRNMNTAWMLRKVAEGVGRRICGTLSMRAVK